MTLRAKAPRPSPMARDARAATVRYGAFISYSHAASAEVARGLQKWLQAYAKPWWRWRAVNVFRDETDLTASPALWSTITEALDQSSHFILLASPNAAQSKWIKREVRYWLGDQSAGALDGSHLDAPITNPTACGAPHRPHGRRHQLGRRSRKRARLRLEQNKRHPSSTLRCVSRRVTVGRSEDRCPTGTPAHQPFA